MEFWLAVDIEVEKERGRLYTKTDSDRIHVGDRLYCWDGKQDHYIGRALESTGIPNDQMRVWIPDGNLDG